MAQARRPCDTRRYDDVDVTIASRLVACVFVSPRRKSRCELDTSTVVMRALTLRAVRRHLVVERDSQRALVQDVCRPSFIGTSHDRAPQRRSPGR
jgi:hypothetical protein